jgi:hypothetical protein
MSSYVWANIEDAETFLKCGIEVVGMGVDDVKGNWKILLTQTMTFVYIFWDSLVMCIKYKI